MRLLLNVHGFIISIQGEDASLMDRLCQEFHYFVQDSVAHPEFRLTYHLAPPPEIPKLVAVKITGHACVYQLGERQYVEWFGGGLTTWDKRAGEVDCHSTQADVLFEITFLALHSILGQKLDRQGIHRIHALGVSLGRTHALVMLPSKGGKSTLLNFLLQDPAIKVLSDDTPLVDPSGRLHPFPTKVSLDQPPVEGPLASLTWKEFRRVHHPPKWTASLGNLSERLARPLPGDRILLYAGFRLSRGESFILPASKWRMVGPLLEHMVVGVGLPQILELFLSFRNGDILKLAGHALLRGRAAFRLLLRSDCYHVFLGPDLPGNAGLLREHMHDHEKD